MINTVAKIELPAGEALQIKKQRILPPDYDETKKYKRICIVTGIHGDELEGQYVCYKLSEYLRSGHDHLNGIVDIYPALNPFGIDTVTRGIPAFDLDMNRIFPGNADGNMNEYVAALITKDIEGADLCVDIHASNIYLTEVPQIRINEITEETLVPIAKHMNVDFIWIHSNSTVLESTLAYSMNKAGVPTLVVEMGVGMRITKEFGDQLVDGIIDTMKYLGAWNGPAADVRTPVISDDPDGVEFLNAPSAGVFIKDAEAGTHVKKGDAVGRLVDPLGGELLSEIKAPGDGWLFTIREYPIVAEGSLMGRILKEGSSRK